MIRKLLDTCLNKRITHTVTEKILVTQAVYRSGRNRTEYAGLITPTSLCAYSRWHLQTIRPTNFYLTWDQRFWHSQKSDATGKIEEDFRWSWIQSHQYTSILNDGISFSLHLQAPGLLISNYFYSWDVWACEIVILSTAEIPDAI